MQIASTQGVYFPNGFPQVAGARRQSSIVMRTSDPRHMTPAGMPASSSQIEESSSGNFAATLQKALRSIENMEGASKSLTRRAAYEPDTVELHTVLLAAQKSRFVLNLTKALTDSVSRTFRELSSLR